MLRKKKRWVKYFKEFVFELKQSFKFCLYRFQEIWTGFKVELNTLIWKQIVCFEISAVIDNLGGGEIVSLFYPLHEVPFLQKQHDFEE